MNHKNYINNEWVDAKDGKTFDVEIYQIVKEHFSILNALVFWGYAFSKHLLKVLIRYNKKH